MAKFRVDQEGTGITGAASFVIDGPQFTKARVGESFDGVHYPHQVYSAGTQILANAMDWLLPDPLPPPPKGPPRVGSMGHVNLGLMILFLAFFGIFGFDGFLGFSYFAALFVPSMAPYRLYHEAFSSLHRRKNLPPIDGNPSPRRKSPSTDQVEMGSVDDGNTMEEESSPLLEPESVTISKDS
mmetsp:Transcript_1568/g.3201  ORF Transcript_1568/g.3201 Transcript_1568/m.3201 type:complete len:183 (+) Transcript_1568:1628-2176(+)